MMAHSYRVESINMIVLNLMQNIYKLSESIEKTDNSKHTLTMEKLTEEVLKPSVFSVPLAILNELNLLKNHPDCKAFLDSAENMCELYDMYEHLDIINNPLWGAYLNEDKEWVYEGGISMDADYCVNEVLKDFVAVNQDSCLRQSITETAELTVSAMDCLYKALDQTRTLFLDIVERCNVIFDELCCNRDSLFVLIERDYWVFARKNAKKTRNALIREARKYNDNIADEVTCHTWGNLLEHYNEIIDTAIHRPKEVDDEDVDIQSEKLEKYYFFLEGIKEATDDNVLFSPILMSKEDFEYVEIFDGFQIREIYSFILRYNIIMCETYPNLKEEYYPRIGLGSGIIKNNEDNRKFPYGKPPEDKNERVKWCINILVKQKVITQAYQYAAIYRICKEKQELPSFSQDKLCNLISSIDGISDKLKPTKSNIAGLFKDKNCYPEWQVYDTNSGKVDEEKSQYFKKLASKFLELWNSKE